MHPDVCGHRERSGQCGASGRCEIGLLQIARVFLSRATRVDSAQASFDETESKRFEVDNFRFPRLWLFQTEVTPAVDANEVDSP